MYCPALDICDKVSKCDFFFQSIWDYVFEPQSWNGS